MAYKRTTCNACNRKFRRGDRWHKVERKSKPTRWELFKCFIYGKQFEPEVKLVREHLICPEAPLLSELLGEYQPGDENTKEFENV